MAGYTSNLNLYKKDPDTDGADYFNIKTMMNDNWDKIDKLGVIAGAGALWKQVYKVTTAGDFTWTPDFTGQVGVLVVGGGGSGCSMNSSGSSMVYASGGASGEAQAFIMDVTSGTAYAGSVGAGGAKATPEKKNNGVSNAGTESTFNGVTANGGAGGSGLSSFLPASPYTGAVAFNCEYGTSAGVHTLSGFDSVGKPWQCINPFTGEQMLGSGGGNCTCMSDGTIEGETPKLNPVTGLGGGSVGLGANGGDATEPGCGGGAAMGYVSAKTSGAGAAGMVVIYQRIEVSL